MTRAKLLSALTLAALAGACADHHTPPTAPAAGPVADVVADTGTLTATLTASDWTGQSTHEPIVLTATASGGSGSYEYWFYDKYCQDQQPCDTFYNNFARVDTGGTATRTRYYNPLALWEVFFVVEVRDLITGNVYRTAARGTDASGFGSIPEPAPTSGTNYCTPLTTLPYTTPTTSFPFTTYYTDPSTGATTLRNFNRNPCTGAKRWQP